MSIELRQEPDRSILPTFLIALLIALALHGSVLVGIWIGSSLRPVAPSPMAPAPSADLAAAPLLVLFGTMAMFYSVLVIAYVLSIIILLVWVIRDTRNRGMSDGAIWVVVILIAHVIGLLVYLMSRPAGDLVPCVKCEGRRLPTLKPCPHCGAVPATATP